MRRRIEITIESERIVVAACGHCGHLELPVRKETMRPSLSLVALFVLVVALLASSAFGGPEASPMHLLKFSAGLDRLVPGKATITFAVYRDEEGGTPLWTETQTIDVDDAGRFTVLLGAVERIPQEIFSNGEARWLGIQRVAENEEPRVLLAAVPYALKAADADTLGGRPLSSFVLRDVEDETGGGAMRTPQLEVPRVPRQFPPALPGTDSRFEPVSHVAAATGFQLASVSGATSIGFATTGGQWKVYLKASSASGFDSANLRMYLSDTQLTVLGSVYGQSSFAGVQGYGLGAGSWGVHGDSVNIGVHGQGSGSSGNTVGVMGESNDNAATNFGVWGSGGEYGVYGSASSTAAGATAYGLFGHGGSNAAMNYGVYGFGGEYGIVGENTTSVAGFGAVVGKGSPNGPEGTGVRGKGYYGVWGEATGTSGTTVAVYADAPDTPATNYGMYANGADYGVWAVTSSASGFVLGGMATGGGELISMWSPNNRRFRVTNVGDVQADGTYTSPAGDLAERVEATELLQAGDVVEIDPTSSRRYRLCRTARSALVAGVISTLPGVLLNDKTLGDDPIDARPPLALAGQVSVKVTSENGAIRPGDMLVASSTPGHAMRADASPAAGTVIGKAVEPLDSGSGTIRMLVQAR